MSRKTIIFSVVAFLIVLNSAAVAGLYLFGYIFQPSVEALEVERLALEKQQKEAEDAIKYAHLEPLPEFKSRVGYVTSMGEAIAICERALKERETLRKSSAVNHIESRYLPHIEQYKIFLDYETIPLIKGGEPKFIKVICEVEEATKLISTWKPTQAKQAEQAKQVEQVEQVEQ